jgi:hypothetical protein
MMTMVISGSDGVTFPDSTNQFSGGAFSFKNRILNGDMRIDQRSAGASVSITSNNLYTVDRWQAIGQSADGVFTVQQDSSAPSGFNNSAKITITTEDASIGATQQYLFRQLIEGYNVADLNWGTANAKTITVSFYVRSSVTGTFGGSIRNSSVNRSYPFTYTISAADTWEYKTVTIAGDTSGTWLTTNSTGLEFILSLGSGADRVDTAGAWVGANRTGATGQTQLIGTLNATWFITGVQLEVGSVATPFERRPYGTELALCQRYCIKYCGSGAFERFAFGVGNTATNIVAMVSMPVEMRSTPTLTHSTLYFDDAVSSSGAASTIAVSSATSGVKNVTLSASSLSGITTNRPYFISANNSTSAFAILSAEL